MTAPTIHICPVCGEDDGLDEQECRRCGARLWDNEDDRPPKGGAALKRPRNLDSVVDVSGSTSPRWRRLRRCRCSCAPENPGATRSRKRARVPAPAVLAALEGGR